MNMSEQVLWELMEMEAKEQYYIDNATIPAIIISTGLWTDPRAKRSEYYTVWFGRGLASWNFKTLKAAREKVQEILATATKPIQIRVEKGGERR